jgi:2-polyprenyl-3-methyl-5-hydroxy-6-metoxy-1,4-benzoquinol methylase
MDMPLEILPYIEGKEFGGLVPLKIKQEENVRDRMDFVEEIVSGKSVIHVGCLDHLPLIEDKISCDRWFHGRLTKTSSECLGIDINKEGIEIVASKLKISNICYANIEDEHKIPEISARYWDYIVFGEIIEHVDNPVYFLQKFISNYQENIGGIIITVPNAFRAGNIKNLFQNVEAINTDHRYWFSPYTIWKVVHQAGLTVENIQMCKYAPTDGIGGKIKDLFLRQYPLMAENIVVICRLLSN